MTLRQVAGPDAAFLYGERPEWHFHVSALMLLDPATSNRFSHDAVIDELERRIHEVPQFRWKLVEAPMRLRMDRPIWVDDPTFDVRHHVHRVAVPSPGDERALGALVGRLMSFKIDRTRPLWEIWLIEGLAGGRVGLLMKIHHAIIDGQSGAELATLLYDLEPDPPARPDPPAWEPEPMPSITERLARSATNNALTPWRLGKLTRQMAGQAVVTARHALGAAPPAQPLQAPRTPFNGKLTPDRLFASARLSLSEAKQVKDAFGVKLNDVVLATASGGLREYLHDLGELPNEPLVAQVPVSIRNESTKDHVGTKVAAMFCDLATQVADPALRLEAIHRGTERAKEMRHDLDEHHQINLTDTLPPAAVALASRAWSLAGLDGRTPPIFNLIVSNVPGPPFDLYLAGARIDAAYPMGPLLYGSGVNLTVVSNNDHLDFGVQSCPSLMPDPWQLADRLIDAFDDLKNAAGV